MPESAADAVDAVMALSDRLDHLPVAEHVELLEGVLEDLRSRLAVGGS